MAHFVKKRGKSKPAISTASLPDIIFMLLFFFMVVTVLREGERKVRVVVPQATELQKLEQKSLVNHIWIGRPIEKFQSTYGSKPRIQLGDKFANEYDIPLFLEQHKIKVPEVQRPRITTSLKVDGDVTMGIVSDVKTSLRKAGQLKLNYSARPRQDNL
ncbi:MAG: biopolymer transporter ExbD [Saprospiraceae bacterium]|nr:biopolymer transporter ExbD [Saprospiraceae bacterium]